jgi:hypothetical protein
MHIYIFKKNINEKGLIYLESNNASKAHKATGIAKTKMNNKEGVQVILNINYETLDNMQQYEDLPQVHG